MITFFNAIRNNCKYEHPGYNEDHQLEYTCRHKDNTPPGSSWGVCDEAHCPIMKQHKEALIPPMESTAQEAPKTLADEWRDMMEEPYTYFISYTARKGYDSHLGSLTVKTTIPIEKQIQPYNGLIELQKDLAEKSGNDHLIILNFQRL